MPRDEIHRPSILAQHKASEAECLLQAFRLNEGARRILPVQPQTGWAHVKKVSLPELRSAQGFGKGVKRETLPVPRGGVVLHMNPQHTVVPVYPVVRFQKGQPPQSSHRE